MRTPLLALAMLVALSGCAEVQTYGAVAIEQRRTMNDLQARATMAATCDIALGAYFRELSPVERRYAGLVCGGLLPDEGAVTTPTS
ncbi:MAG: hypothetical protein U1E17_11735 [Geminicoccaceae bacterium]